MSARPNRFSLEPLRVIEFLMHDDVFEWSVWGAENIDRMSAVELEHPTTCFIHQHDGGVISISRSRQLKADQEGGQ